MDDASWPSCDSPVALPIDGKAVGIDIGHIDHFYDDLGAE